MLAVIGTGTWGVTLALHASRLGVPVTLLARTAAEAAALDAARESPRVPGHRFPDALRVTADAAEALGGAAVVLLVVPAQTMRENARRVRAQLPPDAVLVSASKGLEIGSALRMSQVIAQELGGGAHPIAALSGPNLALEIAAGKPASTVVACLEERHARRVQALLMSPTLRVYTQTDIVGVELGGALKNIVALGAGMCDGLDAGDNAKAALITRGLAEISRLGKAAGAAPLTFAGLAGLGDLLATCMSRLSRNRTVGEQLARGRTLAAIQVEMRQVAEGVPTTIAALQLAKQFGVEMPITELMRRVLFESLLPQEAGAALMQRGPKHELDGIL
ncbi:MAG: NAD(P)-dependent glycerol-3-phosphate dehydrogenase [Chloroflexi bacterium]|nr:NAD(P)-dependent glycerol-3-phosphate dehydrogenase [Chloroflexota bacterium]